MSNKIMASVAVFVLGLIWGWGATASSDQALGSSLGNAIFNAYVCWSLFWGVPTVWGWRRVLPVFPRLHLGFGLFLKLIWWFLAVYFYIFFGVLFCVWGGGVFHFSVELWKCYQGAPSGRSDYRLYDSLRNLWGSWQRSPGLREKENRLKGGAGAVRYSYQKFEREE